jgi:hypothetical protein
VISKELVEEIRDFGFHTILMKSNCLSLEIETDFIVGELNFYYHNQKFAFWSKYGAYTSMRLLGIINRVVKELGWDEQG